MCIRNLARRSSRAVGGGRPRQAASPRAVVLLLAVALLPTLIPLPGRAALAATPTAGPPPARATPVVGATPTPAPTSRGATPQTPVPDRPGELAGVRYDADRDTVGAGDKVLGYRDEQLRNGVPQADANRIALAHYKYDCQQTGNCDRTGLDLSGVDVNDAHANFGYHPECQVWGVDFTPWWGVWSPPDGQPTCAGGGGRTSAAGAGFGLDPATLAGRVLAALDWQALLTGLLKGVWELLAGDGIEQLGTDIGGLLLLTPDLRVAEGQMGNVQQLVDALRAAAVGACVVAFVLTVIRFWIGEELAPQAALGRLGGTLFALAFYRQLVGWLVEGANVVTRGVFAAGADVTTPVFTTAFKLLLPTAAPFWYILSLLGLLLLVAVGVVKIVGLAFLLLTYVAGPLLLPLGIHPRTAAWVGLWAEHLVKVLLWPVIWALEFRLFGAVAGGITFVDQAGGVSARSLGGGALGALTALALLALMAHTPWTLHTRFTVRQGAQLVLHGAARAAGAAAVVATGGTSLTLKGAVASTLAERRTRRPGAGGE